MAFEVGCRLGHGVSVETIMAGSWKHNACMGVGHIMLLPKYHRYTQRMAIADDGKGARGYTRGLMEVCISIYSTREPASSISFSRPNIFSCIYKWNSYDDIASDNIVREESGCLCRL